MDERIKVPTLKQLGSIKPVDESYDLFTRILSGTTGFVSGFMTAFGQYQSYLTRFNDSIQDLTDGSYIYSIDDDLWDTAKSYIAAFLAQHTSFLQVVKRAMSQVRVETLTLSGRWAQVDRLLTVLSTLGSTRTIAPLMITKRTAATTFSVETLPIVKSDNLSLDIEAWDADTDTVGDISYNNEHTTVTLITDQANTEEVALRHSYSTTTDSSDTWAASIAVKKNTAESDDQLVLTKLLVELSCLIVEREAGTVAGLAESQEVTVIPSFIGPSLAQVYIVLKTISTDMEVPIPLTETELADLGSAVGAYL
jgi:hypothetical protein